MDVQSPPPRRQKGPAGPAARLERGLLALLLVGIGFTTVAAAGELASLLSSAW